MLQIFALIIFFTSLSSIIEFAFLYLSSLSGKCLPISPNATAPSNESIIACVKTSASLCPRSPFSKGTLTPPRIKSLPATNL